MTDTPIGDAVAAELDVPTLYPPAGTTLEEFQQLEADRAEAGTDAVEDDSPDAHEEYALTDPEPVLNDDADDDLSDVPDGDDDGTDDDLPADDPDPAES